MDINAHTPGQSQGATKDFQQSRDNPLHAPQRRPEAAMSAVLRYVWPQCTRHGRSCGAATQTQKGDHALGAPWEVVDDPGQATATDFEGEAVQ